MRRWWALLLLLAMVTSCPGQTMLRESTGKTPCVEYHQDMSWNRVAAQFGTPDLLPRPEPGTELSQNARGYRDMTVIFYTKRQQINEAGKIRFEEVIYKVEICKTK
jgi:hypothetical protein